MLPSGDLDEASGWTLHRNRSRFGRPSLVALSRVRRRQTHLRGRSGGRLCLGGRRCRLGACGPRRRPRNSSVPIARPGKVAGSTHRVTPRCHSAGAGPILRSAPLSQLRLGSARGQSQRWILAIAGCRFEKTRTRDACPIQADAVRNFDAERPSGLRRLVSRFASQGSRLAQKKSLSSRSSLVSRS